MNPINLPPIANNSKSVPELKNAMDLWTRQASTAIRALESAINSGAGGGSNTKLSALAPLSYNSFTGVLSIGLATTSHDGYLSSIDWNTFNNKQPALGYTPPPNTRLINTTSPLLGGGDLTADRTLSIQLADTSHNGYLSSTDWNTFNNKVPSARQILTSAPLLGGGDLSADRTISIPKADSTHDGYLSSSDFNTFSTNSGGGGGGSGASILQVQVFS